MSDFYATPSYMSGGYLPIYAGARRHRGGGFLGSVRSNYSPLKKAFSSATARRKHFAPIKRIAPMKRIAPIKRVVPIKRSVTSGVRTARQRSIAVKKLPTKAAMKTPARSLLSSSAQSIGKSVARGAKSMLNSKTMRQIGKKAFQTGAEIGTQVAIDALTGNGRVGDSITTRAKETALETLTGQRANGIKRPSVQAQRKLKQRKRVATFNFSKSAPPGKRLRKARSRARLNRRQLF